MTRKTPYNSTFRILFPILILSGSCLTAGTHGSIQAYEYMTTKLSLQKAVENVLQNSYNIRRDTVSNYMIDVTNGRNDTIYNNYYNDGERYVSIIITTEEGDNDYTFQYAGDNKYWDTSKIASISLVYAHDNNGNGGSEGNGGFKWHSSLKKKLLDSFEKTFISKVDKELKLKHTTSN